MAPEMPARDVERRAHDLAGLADLVGVLDPAGVDRRARRTDRAAEGVGQRLDEGEVLGPLDAATAGDDDVGLGHIELAARRRRPVP